jgi:hypothetical protein
MPIPNRQIGWSNESNLLWQVSKEIDRLTTVTGSGISSIISLLNTKITNEQGVPAFFADTLVNIPTPGEIGRMFVSTDTYAFYRDNGAGWDLIGGPGTGTVTGAGVSGQVSYWNGTSTVTGSNNLFWDAANSRLGVGTNTPSYKLDVNGTSAFRDNVYIPTASKYLFIGTTNSSYAFGHLIRAVGTTDASIGIFRNQASSSAAKLEFFRSRGTYDAPTALNVGDTMMSITGFGWGTSSTQYVNAGIINLIADAIGTNGVQGRFRFTTYNSTGSNFNTMELRNSGVAPGSAASVLIASDSVNNISAPLGTLHVRGFDATSSNNAFYVESSLGTTKLFQIANDGQVLIGTGALAGFKLDVNGTARVQGELTVKTMTVGRGAGDNATNTAVGVAALAANTTGIRSTSFGYLSLASNINGSDNSSFGFETLRSNTSGTGNIAFGFRTLQFNTTGGYNNFFGNSAGFANTEGSHNNFFGLQAGYNNTSGSDNNFFGCFFINFFHFLRTIL